MVSYSFLSTFCNAFCTRCASTLQPFSAFQFFQDFLDALGFLRSSPIRQHVRQLFHREDLEEQLQGGKLSRFSQLNDIYRQLRNLGYFWRSKFHTFPCSLNGFSFRSNSLFIVNIVLFNCLADLGEKQTQSGVSFESAFCISSWLQFREASLMHLLVDSLPLTKASDKLRLRCRLCQVVAPGKFLNFSSKIRGQVGWDGKFGEKIILESRVGEQGISRISWIRHIDFFIFFWKLPCFVK